MNTFLTSLLVILFTSVSYLYSAEATLQTDAAVAEVAVSSAPSLEPSVAQTTVTVETPKEVVPPPVPEPPKEIKPIGFVAPLTDLTRFYEDELISAKKLIERWNERLRAYVEREQSLEAEKDKFSKELAEKSGQNAKGNKKEVSELKKQVKRLEKDLKAVRKDLERIKKELMAELKEMGAYAAKTITEKFDQVKEKVKTFNQEE